LPEQDFTAESLEERLVMYADKFHSKPPRFNSFAQYVAHAAKFGQEKFAAAYFDDDQMRSFQEIAAANSLEIGSFLVLLEQDGLLPERLRSSAPAISIAEAREQSERFGVDAITG
jgi:hypothetical protein